MTDRPTAVPVRPGERSTTAFRVTFALAAFIAVAIVKPWGEPAAGPSGQGASVPPPTPRSGASTAPLPATSVEAVPVAGTSCLSSDAEQLVVVERWPDNEVRSWIAVDQVPASGPLDPALVSIDVFAAHAVGLGVCAPSDDGTRSAAPAASQPGRQHAATIVDVQLIPTSTTGRVVDLGAPVELPGLGIGPDTVRLYGPPVGASTSEPGASTASNPPASARAQPPGQPTAEPATAPTARDSDGTWAIGSYAVAFQFPFDAPTTRHWLRFALVRGGGNG